MTKTLTEQQIRKIIENVTGKAAKVCEQKFYEKPKSLTEKWKDGELPSGFYYVSIPGAVCGASILDDYELQAYKSVRDSNKIEVLSEVPSYSEYQALKDNCELTHTRLKGVHQKIHILNEQNTKQYNELCEEIKKNNILKKRLEIATKALERIDDLSRDNDGINDGGIIWCFSNALKEMEGVK